MSSKEEALAAIDTSGVAARQRWKHWKGAEYTITATGIDEASLEPVVMYVGHDGIVWTRKLAVFLEPVASGEPRFTRVKEGFARDDSMWVPTSDRGRGGRFL